jgi:uncharacterized protein YndB with AHSA1/START domain
VSAKKVLAGVAILIAAVALILVLGGLAIDPTIAIGTEKTLESSPAELWKQLDNPAGLERWWSMSVRKIAGPDSGPGLVVEFVADDRVIETWTLKSADAPNEIVYDVAFTGMMTVERTLTLTPADGGTKVTWRETGSIDNPLARWGKVVMTPDSVIANFDRALMKLDEAAKTSTTAG